MNQNENNLNIFKIACKTITIIPKRDKSDKKFCIKSFFQWAISAVLSIIISTLIAFSPSTVDYMKEIFKLTNDIVLAFLAIIIGAFALYQALLSAKVVLILYKHDDTYKKLNETWLGIIILFLFEAIVNYFFSCISLAIPCDFTVFKNGLVNNIVAMILIFIYSTFVLRTFIEVNNFIINLYNMFQVYNKVKLLEELEQDKDNDSE